MMNFNSFIGNEKVKEQLRFLEASNRLPHAIMIEGEEGLGKRTLAKEIVLNLFCRGEGERPCRHCPQCVKAEKGIHPDVYEYTAENRPQAFHIETVREVKREVYLQPNEADYRVFILGNCQSMTAEAQNAILKILEEPPSYAVFIMTVTNKSAMLETVLSRCVVISLEGVPAAEGAEYLCQRDSSLAYEDALRACEVWGGNLGKAAESLADGKLSRVNAIAVSIAAAMTEDNEYALLKACSAFGWDKELMLQTLTALKAIVRDALVCGGADCVSGNGETAKRLAARLSRDKLVKSIEAIDALIALVKRNANMQLMMTRISSELRKAQGR